MKSVFNILAISICLTVAGPTLAKRNSRHIVKSGDTIAEIARFHGVEQQALREANDLGDKGVIHPGDELAIPDELVGGWTKSRVVKKGDTLNRIARRYKVGTEELAKLNKIGPGGRLKVGQRLVIPKGKRIDPSVASGDGKSEKKRWSGKAIVVRVRDSERKTMTMFDKRGRPRMYARRTISHLARSKKGRVRLLHPRLIKVVGAVAEHFPGRTIEIVSGFRPHRRGRRRSQHSKARALDLRVRGVENLELYNYLKTFQKVGVGYYPNSTFVHLDVRDRKYLWTDVSPPGEPAVYVRAGELGSAEQIAIESAEGLPDPENFPEDGLEGEPATSN